MKDCNNRCADGWSKMLRRLTGPNLGRIADGARWNQWEELASCIGARWK
jgi:hypothetical protein